MCVKKIDYEIVKNLIRGVGRIIRFRMSNQFLAKGFVVGRVLLLLLGQKKIYSFPESTSLCLLKNVFSL